MQIARSVLHRLSFMRRAVCWLPQRCLLCAAPVSGTLALCAACAGDLPRNDVACAACGLPLSHSAARCGRCQRRPPPWDTAWAPFQYGWPLDRLETRFKFNGDLAAGCSLALSWAALEPPSRPDCLVPVPLHAKRVRQRGFNQALELTRTLASAWHLPCRPGMLRRQTATAAQSQLDARARRRNVRGAFARGAAFEPMSHVALVDDVMTTGSTLAECVRVLRRAGVARIDVWVLARAPRPTHANAKP